MGPQSFHYFRLISAARMRIHGGMFDGLRYYSVSPASREPLRRFIIDGLIISGCRILFASEPSRAPFVISFETRDGERMGIIAYAFLATRTPTRNRPSDERSFQIKYGSKEAYADANLHDLWQDPLGLMTTLLIAIDPVEGFFVAADPEVHSPTKFFIRVEFKDEDANTIKRDGWHAWERSRRSGPMAAPVEVLVGGRQEMLLRLVRFEQAARGLPPGDRQLLVEKIHENGSASFADPSCEPASIGGSGALLRELQLSSDEVLEVIARTKRLKMAVRGWVAEEHLRTTLGRVPGVTDCEALNADGGPDLRLRYRDGPPLSIECKNVLRVPNKTKNLPRIDFQRTRASKSDPCSRYYAPEDFHIVAGCLHAVTESWEFRYVASVVLDPHQKCIGKLASNVVVDERWSTDLRETFEAANARLV